jgi:hypothetical protein
VLANYSLRRLQQIADFNVRETCEAQLQCLIRLRCSFHALNYQYGKQSFDAVSRRRLVFRSQWLSPWRAKIGSQSPYRSNGSVEHSGNRLIVYTGHLEEARPFSCTLVSTHLNADDFDQHIQLIVKRG